MAYKIWDDAEKSFVWDSQTGDDYNFKTEEEAEKVKDNMLLGGMYHDRPHTVYVITESI